MSKLYVADDSWVMTHILHPTNPKETVCSIPTTHDTRYARELPPNRRGTLCTRCATEFLTLVQEDL